jgi:hypothetical protein
MVRGVLNANARFNLADIFDPDVAASFAIATPTLGTIRAETLTGELFYRDGQALLTAVTCGLPPTPSFCSPPAGVCFPNGRDEPKSPPSTPSWKICCRF